MSIITRGSHIYLNYLLKDLQHKIKQSRPFFETFKAIKMTSEPDNQGSRPVFDRSKFFSSTRFLHLLCRITVLWSHSQPIYQGRDCITISLGIKYHVGRSPDETRSTSLLHGTRKRCCDFDWCHAVA